MQYALPQHFISTLMGWASESRILWLKNFLINQFIRLFKVNMREAAIEDPQAYPSFNNFFIRQLKPDIRPIAEGQQDIASPADGTITQIGRIDKNQLLQAKNLYFDLETLLGGDTDLATLFQDGAFATLYLAPNNYHRVHMPFSGKLERTIYVPGKLFSVNRMTSELVPNLFSRNERLISIFDTNAGPMAVILVGAMIVGSIQTVWKDKPIRARQIINETFSNGIELTKGTELGYFKMGSTVIILFAKDKIEWTPSRQATSMIRVGQILGNVLKN